MKRMVYLTAALLSTLTMMLSFISGKQVGVVLERSAIVFLSTLALVILFTHLLSWGLKMTSVREQEQRSLTLENDTILENERDSKKNTAI